MWGCARLTTGEHGVSGGGLLQARCKSWSCRGALLPTCCCKARLTSANSDFDQHPAHPPHARSCPLPPPPSPACPPRSYVNTSACKSRVSYIDGDRGVLRYRGYPIEQLAERSSFLEVRTRKGLAAQGCTGGV